MEEEETKIKERTNNDAMMSKSINNRKKLSIVQHWKYYLVMKLAMEEQKRRKLHSEDLNN